MFRNSVQLTAAIVCDAARALAPVPAIGDWHKFAGYHRYYSSSAFNGGERTLEAANGQCFWNLIEK